MGSKQTLYSANMKKDDEYYTLYDDIANEVPLYKNQLKNKRIICPCDWDESYEEEIVFKLSGVVAQKKNGQNIREIDIELTKLKIEKDINLVKCNFVKFLVAHAEDYEIKSIAVSGYNPLTNNGVKFQDVDYSQYDIAITNPPFSLFREFIETMFANEMQFLIIGPLTAITYKECFSRIQNNEMWLGYAKQLIGFELSDGTKLLSKNPEGSVSRACKWYTNLDVSYRHDRMILTEKYNISSYPNYYNYVGIDVNAVKNIPYDYDGVMGVPITFLQKFNPDQFEIIGKGVQAEKTIRFKGDKATLWIAKDGKPFKAPFERILIKHKKGVRK